MKKLSGLFAVLAILVTAVAAAVILRTYSAMQAGAAGGYSAPAEIAWLYAIPFAVGIIVCIVLAVYFGKKAR